MSSPSFACKRCFVPTLRLTRGMPVSDTRTCEQLFVVYPSVSVEAFNTFSCIDLGRSGVRPSLRNQGKPTQTRRIYHGTMRGNPVLGMTTTLAEIEELSHHPLSNHPFLPNLPLLCSEF